MVGKVIEGKSFGGCVAYLLDREKAKILYAEGIRTDDSKAITMDFNAQRKMNPNLTKAVGHYILSWSEKDSKNLTEEVILKATRAYLDRMNIKDTQILIVQHTDRAHPHAHIVFNRVNNDGQTITNSFVRKRNLEATRTITQQWGFQPANEKRAVNRGRLKGTDKVKYEIYDAVKSALKTANNWDDLKTQLQYRGIGIQFKTRRGSDVIQGVSFSKNGIQLKGSDVDRSFSYSKLDQSLSGNNKQLQNTDPFAGVTATEKRSLNHEQPIQEIKNEKHIERAANVGTGLLEILMDASSGIQQDVDDEFKTRKRKRKRKTLKR